MTGITCCNCQVWFTVIANLVDGDPRIRFCPCCGHEYTEDEMTEMLQVTLADREVEDSEYEEEEYDEVDDGEVDPLDDYDSEDEYDDDDTDVFGTLDN